MSTAFRFTSNLLKTHANLTLPLRNLQLKRSIWNWRVGWLLKPWPKKGTREYRIKYAIHVSKWLTGLAIVIYFGQEYGYLSLNPWETDFTKLRKIDENEQAELQAKSDELIKLAMKRQENANLKLDVDLPYQWPPPFKK